MPFVPVWKIIRAAACAIFIFEKCNIAFAVLILFKLAVDAVFSVLETAALCKNRVDVLL